MKEQETETGGNAAVKKDFRRRKRVLVPASLIILVTALATGYWHRYLRSYESTDDAYIDGDPVTISSKILGRITMLSSEEGDSVRQGQVVVQLDDSDLKAQEAQAKASLEYTRRSVQVSKIGFDLAKDDFDRASYQYNNKVITREQFDHARKALELADAHYQVALSQVDASSAQLGVVETQLQNTKVMAPLPGVVARKWVVPGDIVQPGQPILTLYDLDHVWITANFEETKLGDIRLGDPVRISVDAHRGHEFTGKIVLIGAAAASQFSLIPPNNASGNFTKVTQRVPVRIAIDAVHPDPAGERVTFLPGMSVEVKVRVKER